MEVQSDTPAPQNAEQDKKSSKLIVAAVIVIVVLIAIVAAVYMWLNKSREDQRQQDTAEYLRQLDEFNEKMNEESAPQPEAVAPQSVE